VNTQQLRIGGERARQIISSTQSTLLDDRLKILNAAVKDLLPNQEDIHGAVLEGCLFLLKIEANSGGDSLGKVTISALTSQLHRTYNDQTVLEAVCFAEGFLGIEESRSSSSRLEALQNYDPITSSERAGSTYSATESYTSNSKPDTKIAKMQGPQKLIVAGSLLLAGLAVTLLGVTTLKLLEGGNQSNGSNKDELRSAGAQENSPIPESTIKDLSHNGNALRQPQSTWDDLGYAVGGQKLQLDLASIRAYPNSANIDFRYSLGNENIDSIADCGRRQWMTLPERKWHSPQSAATERMLSRVCEAFRSDTPEISSSGAAIVFDPPSNVRTTPNGGILCSITSRGTIPIQGKRGDWYETDYCGSPGYIHKGQVRF